MAKENSGLAGKLNIHLSIFFFHYSLLKILCKYIFEFLYVKTCLKDALSLSLMFFIWHLESFYVRQSYSDNSSITSHVDETMEFLITL